ncbi:DUF192 domain-containing protein [Pyruvatibacter sp.]|uniref:DUF192 domain-containing protein n=1 Tax=Pyruvatibacter sp. TaxID=1981328 RepID=UPI0032663432
MRNLAAVLLAAALAVTGLAACAEPDPSHETAAASLTIETSTGVHGFKVELANTEERRRTGLMFREDLALDAGMLFDFESPRVITMWMRNTPLPLDMIFIDPNGRIVSVAENTVPYSEAIVSSRYPASAVFEVNAGTAKRIGIKVGDRVSHPLFEGPATPGDG